MAEFLRIRPVMIRMIVRVLVRIVFAMGLFGFAMGLCGLISCQPPASTSGATSAARLEIGQTNGPVRDLTHDEAAVAHILRKHVGHTAHTLPDRPERARHIT